MYPTAALSGGGFHQQASSSKTWWSDGGGTRPQPVYKPLPQHDPRLLQTRTPKMSTRKLRELCIGWTTFASNPEAFTHLRNMEIECLIHDSASSSLSMRKLRPSALSTAASSVATTHREHFAASNTSDPVARDNGEFCKQLNNQLDFLATISQKLAEEPPNPYETPTMEETLAFKLFSRTLADPMSVPKNPLMNSATRASVILWMARVVQTLGWPLASFFTAVHAMDYTIFDPEAALQLLEPSRVDGGTETSSSKENGMPLLSTACVLVGVTSECDHKQLHKARGFVGYVPNIPSVQEIICKQLAVVSFLRRGSLVQKTPLDFMMIYLSSLEYHDSSLTYCAGIPPPTTGRGGGGGSFTDILWSSALDLPNIQPGPSLVEYAVNNILPSTAATSLFSGFEPNLAPLMETTVDLCLSLGVVCFIGRLYFVMPTSVIMAAVMLDIFSLVLPYFSSVVFCRLFCECVFMLDYHQDVLPLWKILPQLYGQCFEHIATYVPNGETEDRNFLYWSPTVRALLRVLILKGPIRRLPTALCF